MQKSQQNVLFSLNIIRESLLNTQRFIIIGVYVGNRYDSVWFPRRKTKVY